MVRQGNDKPALDISPGYEHPVQGHPEGGEAAHPSEPLDPMSPGSNGLVMGAGAGSNGLVMVAGAGSNGLVIVAGAGSSGLVIVAGAGSNGLVIVAGTDSGALVVVAGWPVAPVGATALVWGVFWLDSTPDTTVVTGLVMTTDGVA